MAKITKTQQEQIGFMVMWSNDFNQALHHNKNTQHMDWYAKMAVDQCEELGMDAAKVLGDAYVTCANRYKNTPRAA